MPAPRQSRLSHEQRIFYYALLSGLPAVIAALTMLWVGDYQPKQQWTFGLIIVLFWLGFALALRERVVRPLQTMANLLTALREGDFSVRARGANRDEPLGDVLAEVNLLGGVLQEQRLVRVIGHELNNSLAPIKSIAGSLTTMLRRPVRAADWEQDMVGGLEIIEARAEGLNRFMQSYARLAKLPAPNRLPCDIGPLLRRIASLETRVAVRLVEGPDVTASLDAAQVEQVVINLMKNAAEAVADGGAPGGGVRLGWRRTAGALEIFVEDDGPGIANPQNLFVPFFTTKPSGSGIGLVLCRQIAENHGGALTLENREGTTGCIARLRLPT